MTSRRRVVVTGLGVVSPVGNSVGDFWRALTSGRTGVGRATGFDTTSLPTAIAAEIKDFDPCGVVDRRTARALDPAALYLLAAGSEAVRTARLDGSYGSERKAVVVGFDLAQVTAARVAASYQRQGHLGVDSFTLYQTGPYSASAALARSVGATGSHDAISAACASGAVAVLRAWQLLQLDAADVAIAGCCWALDALTLASCAAARVASRNPDSARAMRPFDRLRDGFVPGEGAAVLVLEDLEHAVRRGAPIEAELLGGRQNTSLGASFTENDAASAAACLRGALEASGVTPDDVDLVSAHATSTQRGDRQEAEALRLVFGERRVPAFAAKSMLGHCLSAAAGLETIALLLAMREGVVPPTVNHEHPDPQCPVDCVPNESRAVDASVGVKNAFGFGGVNCCLVFRRLAA